MKLAIVTNDGLTVSQHFGRARFYLVVEVDGKEEVDRELRPRFTPHHSGGAGHGETHAPGQPHGTGPDAMRRHAAMAEAIRDCDVLIAGGMGTGAVQAVEASGIRVILTELGDINQVVRAFVEGTLQDRRERMD